MEMDDEWIMGILDKIKVGHISTLNGEQPFINPSSFFYNKDKHEIYFHSNAYGRMRFNAERGPKVCFECSRSGRLLPSNLALEMSFKYFNEMISGKDYRPITDEELKQTSVYGISINSWSGKKNWEEKAEQAEDGEWPDLDKKWFERY